MLCMGLGGAAVEAAAAAGKEKERCSSWNGVSPYLPVFWLLLPRLPTHAVMEDPPGPALGLSWLESVKSCFSWMKHPLPDPHKRVKVFSLTQQSSERLEMP